MASNSASSREAWYVDGQSFVDEVHERLESLPKTGEKTPFLNDVHTFGPCSLVIAEDFAVALGTLSELAKDRGLVRLSVHLASARRVAVEEVR